jgi:hypothetical protein
MIELPRRLLLFLFRFVGFSSHLLLPLPGVLIAYFYIVICLYLYPLHLVPDCRVKRVFLLLPNSSSPALPNVAILLYDQLSPPVSIFGSVTLAPPGP